MSEFETFQLNQALQNSLRREDEGVYNGHHDKNAEASTSYDHYAQEHLKNQKPASVPISPPSYNIASLSTYSPTSTSSSESVQFPSAVHNDLHHEHRGVYYYPQNAQASASHGHFAEEHFTNPNSYQQGVYDHPQNAEAFTSNGHYTQEPFTNHNLSQQEDRGVYYYPQNAGASNSNRHYAQENYTNRNLQPGNRWEAIHTI